MTEFGDEYHRGAVPSLSRQMEGHTIQHDSLLLTLTGYSAEVASASFVHSAVTILCSLKGSHPEDCIDA